MVTMADPVQVTKADDSRNAQDRGVVPRDPVAVFELPVIRDVGLGEVVRGLEGEAGVIGAVGIAQG